ncbi:hypothetical protein HZH68_014063 [Vespula germanica]|uniref:Uncharacterized protein n=1 Tax=Vespula germanica TaxID=30212 RepID=A0A834JF33_VESGE|nr:hypothetical protein HZH68_014063 [Vespula germanica]
MHTQTEKNILITKGDPRGGEGGGGWSVSKLITPIVIKVNLVKLALPSPGKEEAAAVVVIVAAAAVAPSSSSSSSTGSSSNQ